MNARARMPLLAGSLALALALPAAAQGTQGPPNAVQGFSQNRNEPIKIESNSLEVRDREQVAYFIDNVRLTQGDTVLECKKLIIHYLPQEEAAPNQKPRQAPQALSASTQRIKRLEAKGGVIVTQKDQTAVGDDGVYDMENNNMTLIGNVVVTQGQNVVRGDRLWVNLETGVSRIETAQGATGRVQAVILPNQPPPAAPGATPQQGQRGAHSPGRGRSAEREKNRPPSVRPMRLN